MPSGAKKRKQAKKKREQQANPDGANSASISDTLSQGNDDPISQDERDSDGGEVNSPGSQDHQKQHHQFNEESEKSVQSSLITEDSSVGVEENVEVSQNTSVENESIVREVSLDKETESIEVEFSKASHNGDDKSSSSSSSSSDDESQAVEEKQKVESHYSAPDSISIVDVERVEEVKEDYAIEKPQTEANGTSITDFAPSADKESPVMPLSEVAKQATEGVQFESVEVVDVVESEFKENEDKLLPKSDVAVVNEEKVLPILNQSAEASNVVSASNANGNEDKLPESSSSQTGYAENVKDSKALSAARTSETGEDIKKAKDFEASESIETKAVVPPAPQMAQRTSFLSCCGLFDVLTGSNR